MTAKHLLIDFLSESPPRTTDAEFWSGAANLDPPQATQLVLGCTPSTMLFPQTRSRAGGLGIRLLPQGRRSVRWRLSSKPPQPTRAEDA